MFIALGASINVLVVVLTTWVSEPVYGQSCSVSPQQIVAYRWRNTTITSPGYPSNYGYNFVCTWRFQAGSSLSDVVKVTFSDFQVGLNIFGSCYDDHLDFYDGGSAMYNLLGSYCGKLHPEVIYSTGPFLYVKFSSDFYDSYKGFSFNVTAVAKGEAAGICREISGGSNDDVLQLSGASGTIFSPDYPYPYPKDSKCIWVISVPAGKRVKLAFQDFDLGIGHTQCKYHSNDTGVVEIRDGKYSWSDELARYCDYNYDRRYIRDIYSTGNHMRITFSSKSSVRRQKGFKARYEVSELSSAAYSKEKCYYGNVNNEKLSLSGTHGTLESPKEGSSYPPNMRCDWVITVPEGKIVKLSFDEFELQPEYGSCSKDYVEVRDGKESYSENKGTFCGLSTPADILSSGRYMRVSFRSDSDSSYDDGFKATFTAEEKEKSSSSSSSVIVAVTVGVIVFVSCICVLVCIAKCGQRRRNQSAAARIPVATQATTTVSHTTRAGVIHHPTPPQQPESQPPFQRASNPYPPPSVGFAPAPSNAYPPPPAYPYPLQPPPPYPGEEQVPQYPPPGQSYPWQQSAQVEPSAPPKEP